MLSNASGRCRTSQSIASSQARPIDWGLRDYGTEGQLGLEPTPEEYVARMVEVFREVRRVLASHGTVWCNMGDSYNSAVAGRPNRSVQHQTDNGGWETTHSLRLDYPGLKPKDLCGLPWRLAFALQADGWYLRSAITWCKPNCMPESVTDRPTKATEQVFLLTKNARYYYDAESIREPHKHDGRHVTQVVGQDGSIQHRDGERWPGTGANARDWWVIPTQPFPEAHFATFPEELVRRCLLAGCPEQVCGECGKARERIVEKDYLSVPTYKDAGSATTQTAGRNRNVTRMGDGVNVSTLGFTDCGHAAYRRGVVIDPFMGSGTVALVARKHNRRAIGIELSEPYCAMAAKRLAQQSLFTEAV